MTAEHILEIQITQPGRITARYLPADLEILRLEQILHPQDELPFDVGLLPTSLTPLDEPLTVLVLSSLSHPLNTLMKARLLGALERPGQGFPLLLVIPVADEHLEHLTLASLPADWRARLLAALQSARPGDWQWRSPAELETTLHECALRYRQARQKNRRLPEPAWQTTHIRPLAASFAEAERYTPAEYTFHELPDHFKHYVSQALAPDERVLYAVRRPSMPGGKKNGLFRRETLQAGVLILTNQRLLHLAELRPPDDANIRYGFHLHAGVLERFERAALQPLGANFLLQTAWRAQGGTAAISWEMPAYTRAALEELVGFLLPFRGGDARGATLARAAFPAPPDALPPLRDPAANDPQALSPLNEAFHQSLASALQPGEQPYAWALIPEWHEPAQSARALAVTNQRILLLPDLAFQAPLKAIATLELTSSILESSLAANYYENGTLKRRVTTFPYPSQGAFQACFEMARRCLAVVPVQTG